MNSIERLLEEHGELLIDKRGFPNIGKGIDGNDFTGFVGEIAKAWKYYDTDIYNYPIALDDSKVTYNLGGGNPMEYKPFPLSIKYIKKVLKDTNLYKYQPAAGDEKYREEIAKYLIKEGFETNLSYNNILITFSTTHAFSLILKLIARPYDVLITTAPTYGLFAFMPERANIKVEMIELDQNNGWKIKPQVLADKIDKINNELKDKYKDILNYTPRVVAFLNQNPHNPLGIVMNEADQNLINQINEICKNKGVFIIDDLVYRDIGFDENLAIPMGIKQEYFENTISMFGLSKSYGLPSIRAGFIVADEKIIRGLRNNLFHQMDSPSIIQSAALAGAFNISKKRDKKYKKYFGKLRKKYEYNYRLINVLIDGISVEKDEKLVKKIKKQIRKECPDNVDEILQGIPGIKMIKNENMNGGFFALFDYTALKNKKYEGFEIKEEQDFLFYLYSKYKIKFILGQSIAWPDKVQFIGRITFALKTKDLIYIFSLINEAVRKLK